MPERRLLAVLAALGAMCATAHAEPRFGIMTDVGVPDGGNASLVFRPVRALRLSVGMGDNMISRGVRGGLTWVPFGWWMSPTVSVDYGHYVDGDANPLARMVTGDKTFSSRELDRVGYDYANAHVGLEFGRTWFTFYIHAGMSWVSGSVRGLDTVASGMSSSSITFTSDPTVTLWAASARVGFILYLAK
jgi:hypothetical protein